MKNPSMLQPVFALAAWTGLVMLSILRARVASSLRREVHPGDFRYGESARVPAYVSLPNRNFMNLLEVPVLFYVVCSLLYVAEAGTPLLAGLAWAYVAARVLHSLVHITYNNVMHRLYAFAISNFLLVTLWILAARALL